MSAVTGNSRLPRASVASSPHHEPGGKSQNNEIQSALARGFCFGAAVVLTPLSAGKYAPVAMASCRPTDPNATPAVKSMGRIQDLTSRKSGCVYLRAEVREYFYD